MIKIDDHCFIDIFHSKDQLWIKIANHYLEHIATTAIYPSTMSLDDAIKKFKNETKDT